MPVQKKTVETEHWVTLCREISVFARYNSLYLRDVDAGIVVYFCLFDDDIVVALRYVGYPSTPEVPRLDPKNSFHSKQKWELKKENKKEKGGVKKVVLLGGAHHKVAFFWRRP